ncbi:MAG: 3-isopropylmalate dehydrogenase [Lachnospiraceae bacterium]|nr:3-isopropylmalate dehydrogenase [Lachnospiraceae bacterium]
MGEETKESAIQWHPAFYAGIQIEFSQEKEKLEFENEHQLGTKPKQIDVLIIKKEPDAKIQKNIGRIFRRYNIIEYKSPEDYISIDDFYQVYGYACFYKADTNHVDEIKANEITITFVCKNRPRELIKHLREERGFRIKGKEGIYTIHGDYFPMQLILTSRLSKEENFWLRYLTNDLKSVEEANRILSEYEGHQNENNHKSVMNVIVHANKEVFKEATKMCEALLELMKDELDERTKVAEKIGRIAGERNIKIQLIQTKLSKGKTVEAIADDLEDSVENILTLIKEMDKEKKENQ